MKDKLIFALAIAVFIGLWTFSRNNPELHNETSGEIEVVKVEASEADYIISGESTFVLDVHIPEQQHISGTDAFIPYNQISQNKSQLPENKETPILVYCRSGSMSQKASEELIKMGYTAVYDLVGGINAYKESHVSVDILPQTQGLGTVIYGDVARTQFTLTNFTPSPLRITRVSTSCSCTKAVVNKRKLQPYEETVVEVSFDPAVHKDDSDLGSITRNIYIDTDNVNFSRLEAQIQANVVKKL